MIVTKFLPFAGPLDGAQRTSSSITWYYSLATELVRRKRLLCAVGYV
jgi:hypothetical protein